MFYNHEGRRNSHGTKPRVKTALRDHGHSQRLQGPKPKTMPHKRGPSSFKGTYLDPSRGC